MRDTPTTYELQAALTAARLIDGGGCTRESLVASYERSVTGGLYRSPDLERGQALLARVGLLSIESEWCTPTPEILRLRELPEDVAVEVLLQLVLTRSPPLWLFAALEADEVRWENVPDDDAAALRQSITEANRREALLLSLGRTVDAAAQAELGAAGEEHVVAACREYLLAQGREDLAREVRRVSVFSDQLGYDVTSPDTTGRRHRLEVKTLTGVAGGDAPVTFYISRNEAKIGAGDGSWALVAVRKDIVTGDLEVLGWCRGSDFTEALPRDSTDWARWSSVRMHLPRGRLAVGLPLDAVS